MSTVPAAGAAPRGGPLPASAAGGTGGTRLVLRVLRGCLHAAFFALLAVPALRPLLPGAEHGADHWAWAAFGGAVLLGGVYASGPLLMGRLGTGRRAALAWLAAVTALWALLLVHDPDFSWVAFPLFFLHLHLLRRVHAVAAVAMIAAAVVAAQGLHAHTLTLGMALGPLFGAASAVVVALGYAALYRESEQRRRLIVDLEQARDALARSQHRAGVLAERERISREIHDTLAQGLSSIVLLLRSAESALEPGGAGGAAARGRVAEAHRAAADNLEEARRWVRGLSPAALEGGSLPEALERLCARTEAQEGAPGCRFREEGGRAQLPPGHEVALLRAAQVGLSNTVRHAGAGTAVVTLAYLGDEVALDVFDDGRGFRPAEDRGGRSDGTGYGIRGLRSRVEALGGRLQIESAPGEGTALAVALPIPAGENGGEGSRR